MLRIARVAVVVGLMVGAVSASQAADNRCAGFPKGATQTPAGMCIDGVLFKDVLKRLSAIEAKLAQMSSSTTQESKTR